LESIEELAKNINWNNVTLDGLLDFIINESKLLLSSSELQAIVIGEFSRRLREEYFTQENLNLINSNHYKDQIRNDANQQNNMFIKGSSPRKKPMPYKENMSNIILSSNSGKSSFTVDLITKLISMFFIKYNKI
jgi:hypothetical protein